MFLFFIKHGNSCLNDFCDSYAILAATLFRFDYDKSNSRAMVEIKLKYEINIICWIEGWFQPAKKPFQWSRRIHTNCSKSNIFYDYFPFKFSWSADALDHLKTARIGGRRKNKIGLDVVDCSEIVKYLNRRPIEDKAFAERILDSCWIQNSGRLLN